MEDKMESVKCYYLNEESTIALFRKLRNARRIKNVTRRATASNIMSHLGKNVEQQLL